MENISLKQKNVLITGGTSGIGLATALELAQRGANITIIGRHKAKLDEALSQIEKKSGQEALGLVADVSDFNAVQMVFETLDSLVGTIDVLINNAGLPARSVLNTEVLKMEYFIKTSLLGYLYCSKFAAERMLKRGSGGHIVNIGSLSSFTRDADSDLYVAAKSGIEGFNESLRKLISPECVRVSIIDPGSTGTGMIDETSEERQEAFSNYLLLEPEDVARAVLFCLEQPVHCEILRVQLRPHRQII